MGKGRVDLGSPPHAVPFHCISQRHRIASQR